VRFRERLPRVRADGARGRAGRAGRAAGFVGGLGPGWAGAGKTTLLLGLLGVSRPEHGRIALSRRLLCDTARSIEAPIELRRLAYVPQDYSLFPHLSALEQVEFALSAERGKARRERARGWLRVLGVEELADRKPAQLSGGERQRIALARSLASDPQALLMDEPLAALDVRTRASVRAFLRQKLSELGLPTIIVTHDREDARVLSDRIAVLEAGQITQVGRFEELASAPASAYIASFTSGQRGFTGPLDGSA
jgi:molybdate transport system ATP-binding protein